ncbi:MAG: methyltransferase domain-containing protein [Solirubrobacterales bacterium]
MSRVIRYDERPARRIQALSETPEMRAQRRHVLDLLAPQPAEEILDVGCGPSHLARETARAVGPNGRVCGGDVSEQTLALAAGRDLARNGEHFFSVNRYIFLATKP